MKPAARILALAAVAVLCGGCGGGGKGAGGARVAVWPPSPPGVGFKLARAAHEAPMAGGGGGGGGTADGASVLLSVAPVDLAGGWFLVVEGTRDFRTWYAVTNCEGFSVRLVRPWGAEWYRARWTNNCGLASDWSRKVKP